MVLTCFQGRPALPLPVALGAAGRPGGAKVPPGVVTCEWVCLQSRCAHACADGWACSRGGVLPFRREASALDTVPSRGLTPLPLSCPLQPIGPACRSRKDFSSSCACEQHVAQFCFLQKYH